MNKHQLDGSILTVKSEVTGEMSLRAARSFVKDELIVSFNSEVVVQEPNYRTIQVGYNKHVDYMDDLVYLNHSCSPNTYIVIVDQELFLKALSPVAALEELTFFYPSTEWEMAKPFHCYCQSGQCLGWISGAKFLSAEVLGRYFISDYIKGISKNHLFPA